MYTPIQISRFFEAINERGLSTGSSVDAIKDHAAFETWVKRYFGESISKLILDEDSIEKIPLIINGTNWEQVIAKWRLSLGV